MRAWEAQRRSHTASAAAAAELVRDGIIDLCVLHAATAAPTWSALWCMYSYVLLPHLLNGPHSLSGSAIRLA